MPELPEVEVVRAGLAPAVSGAQVIAASVLDARSLKRHIPLSETATAGRSGHGVTLSAEDAAERAADFERRIAGTRLAAPRRRGKFMWIPFEHPPGLVPDCGAASHSSSLALLAHLGMSGQLLLRAHEAPDDRHVTIRLWISHPDHGDLRLDFADQRRFGSLSIDRLVSDAGVDGDRLPSQASHIARDPLDPWFEDRTFVTALRQRRVAIKNAILDQTLISGVGNIYADESLWRARLHPERAASSVSVRKSNELLGHVRDVFAQALAEGGTSFDAQYVNVNGQAGYFAHSLSAYGRAGEPCYRCGATIKRIPFAGRSSHFCPRCQRLH